MKGVGRIYQQTFIDTYSTPMQTFLDAIPIAKEKMIAA